MRNIFDQYSQPENRVSHALASCLHHDKDLLADFVSWITGNKPPKGVRLSVFEQRLPGEGEVSEEESIRRGLPDIWIGDDNGWALLIESKVAATLTVDQLTRHYRTAKNRGFEHISVLALDVVEPNRELPEWSNFRLWSDVYQWLRTKSRTSFWARQATDYLEVAEIQLTEAGYLKEGTLTVFSGVPFDLDEPYNYPEAKRILKLAMDELRQRKALVKTLGIDPHGTGRGAIKGKSLSGVWDFLKLNKASETEAFIKYPHFTLAINQERILASIILPNMAKPSFRNNILDLGYEGFTELMAQVNKNLTNELKGVHGAASYVEIVQRHHLTRSSPATIDAKLMYDLNTAFASKRTSNQVKLQPQWLHATYDALTHKSSNLQMAVGATFPYQHCPATKSPEILDHISGSWIACKPLLDVMLNGH